MKTAISLPDPLFKEAEKAARKRKISRSELYREAVTEYLLRHEPEAITKAMDEVCRKLKVRPDPALSEAARRILEKVEW